MAYLLVCFWFFGTAATYSIGLCFLFLFLRVSNLSFLEVLFFYFFFLFFFNDSFLFPIVSNSKKGRDSMSGFVCVVIGDLLYSLYS